MLTSAAMIAASMLTAVWVCVAVAVAAGLSHGHCECPIYDPTGMM
ncbi:MAG: hypothetical protein ACYSPI_03860 [Planctomycetota bacterium]